MHFSHAHFSSTVTRVLLAGNSCLLNSNSVDVIPKLRTGYQRITDDWAELQSHGKSSEASR